MCPKKDTPSKKRKIPSTLVTAAKSKNSTQQSSIKTFLKKDLTSTDNNWNANTSGNSVPKILTPFLTVIHIQT